MTYERIEALFRGLIGALICVPDQSPAGLYNALINGTGLCNIFDLNYIRKKGDLGPFIDFAKIAYLLREFKRRNLYVSLQNADPDISAIQKLGDACEILEKRTLSKERRKTFLSSVLSYQLIAPIADLHLYIAGNKEDICNKLENDDAASLIDCFDDAFPVRVFVRECVDDLSDLWSNALAELSEARLSRILPFISSTQ